jgi:hypothetical protein
VRRQHIVGERMLHSYIVICYIAIYLQLTAAMAKQWDPEERTTMLVWIK